MTGKRSPAKALRLRTSKANYETEAEGAGLARCLRRRRCSSTLVLRFRRDRALSTATLAVHRLGLLRQPAAALPPARLRRGACPWAARMLHHLPRNGRRDGTTRFFSGSVIEVLPEDYATDFHSISTDNLASDFREIRAHLTPSVGDKSSSRNRIFRY